ncbi:hypothetical protein PHYBLDRAFT_139095 [Phycomyces blakesleeanus NRRL 1555(-)]|uniref:Uncharacterized protein n=1 Tax=Phycomyces blakesleeanus (strain ATCC 8743b / DSM 1359 / FGSC 10004 / NBRC 33097 / NRRL 1555) TaxID=763407 RepID=A0A163BH22_PHYB8|nr:hypothetical protein PHYBLDRAFT_139095 [Phycomyces blakesleeanus NRRL 1555(-)]OAD81551.1 hypothetical protein PHYBLDRAFT_139095 [Phycomyces blakesleeanus NRRL 1555(-)]|eukprot:XP_018299591.1 hypothetical protein PHYBLDRAFT_139095 [Phycomyces blakesleeanus NRRL 1555(-)]
MLHEKLEEYNSAFEKIMEELEEPEMPEDPKSSAPSTTDKTPKKIKEGEQIQMAMGANSDGNGRKFNFYGSQSDVNGF